MLSDNPRRSAILKALAGSSSAIEDDELRKVLEDYARSAEDRQLLDRLQREPSVVLAEARRDIQTARTSSGEDRAMPSIALSFSSPVPQDYLRAKSERPASDSGDPAMLASIASPSAVDYLRPRFEAKRAEPARDRAMASASAPTVMDYLGSIPSSGYRRSRRAPRRSFARAIVAAIVLFAAPVLRYSEVLTMSWLVIWPAGLATAAIVLVIWNMFRR